MENAPLIEFIKARAFDGDSYDTIRQALRARESQFSEAAVDDALNRIDDYVIQYQLAVQAQSKAFNQMIMGAAVFLLGAGISGYSYFLGARQFLLAYGAIIGGAWVLLQGWKIYRLPLEELVPTSSPFKRYRRRAGR